VSQKGNGTGVTETSFNLKLNIRSAVRAGDATACPNNFFFWGGGGNGWLELGKFGWISAKLERNIGKIEAKFRQK